MSRPFHDLPDGIRSLLWANEACRRLGFTPDELFPSMAIEAISGKLHVFMEVIQRGETVFTITIAPAWCSGEELVAQWKKACARWNNPSAYAECQRLWDSEGSREELLALATSMDLKGLRMPGVDAYLNTKRN